MRPMEWGYDIGADEYSGAGLATAKHSSMIIVNPNQVLTYTIVITNAGMMNVSDIVLTDTLDDWQRAIAITSSVGECSVTDNDWGGMVVCTPGIMVTDTKVVVTLTAQVSSTIMPCQAMTNTVVVMSDKTTNNVQFTTYSQDCHVHIDDEATEYTTVQAAVDAANPGDLVKVAGICAGASGREGLRQQVYLDKSVTIRGGYATTNWMTPNFEAHPTTLDALGQGRVLYITGDISPTVEGLRITGGDADGLGGHTWLGTYEDAGGGVYVISATVTISDNQVFSNTAYDGGGLYLELNYSDAMLSGNTVSGNTASDDGGGLYLDPIVYGDAILSGNTVNGNTASDDGGGLYLTSGVLDFTVLNRNTFTANNASNGGGLFLHVTRYDKATLNDNTIIANAATSGGGLYLQGGT